MITATGRRIGWVDLPAQIRAKIEDVAGSRVVSARSQSGGFSPGTADRLTTASGTQVFVKAVSADQNEQAPRMHRREGEVAAALPPSVPAPRLLARHDDGHWVVLVFEDVEGRHPVTPWVAEELDRVLAALDRLAGAGTPAPAIGLRPAPETMATILSGWQQVRADPPAGLAPWAAARLDRLCAQADRAAVAVAGDTLVHQDLRADNLLVRPNGDVVLIDWPWACKGATWLDRLLLLINVRLHGGHDTDALLAGLAARTGAGRDDLIAVLAAAAGYFTDQSRRPAPAGLPTLRAFQRVQGEALAGWLVDLIP